MNSYLQLFLNGIQTGGKVSGKCTVVALTSAMPQEGVSYVTQSFAVELAQRTGKRTLIADASNLQRADMLHYNQVAKFCSQTNVPQLYVFSTEHKTEETETTQQLQPKNRKSELEQGLENLQTLRFVFDYVFLDCAALQTSDTAALFAPAVDGVVVVVEAERTRKEQVRNALNAIETAKGNLLGCVLNKRRYSIPQWIYSRL
jgi:Mrp family chromosome partitioning ATPase